MAGMVTSGYVIRNADFNLEEDWKQKNKEPIKPPKVRWWHIIEKIKHCLR